MIHHLSLGVRDLAAAAAFYDAALRPLGVMRVFEDDTAIGYGYVVDQDILCLKLDEQASAPGPGFHLAFTASARALVDAFHSQGIGAGGRCNGAPGLRPDYGDTYYAAFIIDPDGHRIEAVTKVAA